MELGFILILSLLVVTTTCNKLDSTTAEDTNWDDATTEQTILVRRKPAVRSAGSSGRLALMNSRFIRRPKKKNLDREHLLEIIGDYFDADWMSIDEPSALSKQDKGATYVYRRDGWQHAELTKHLQTSNLSAELVQLGADKILVDTTVLVAFEKWLMKKASCPVKYFWDDIGPMFWPRYIRRGECAIVPGTCSWPPGMHCVPSGTSTLHILRWQCKTPKGKNRRRQYKSQSKKDWNKRVDGEHANLKCHWLRVPYPITSACLCTC